MSNDSPLRRFRLVFDRAAQIVQLTPGEARALAAFAGLIAFGVLVRELRLHRLMPTGPGITYEAGRLEFEDGIRGRYLLADSVAWAGVQAGFDQPNLEEEWPGGTTLIPVPPRPLDVNRASASDLVELPGIGPALAGRIVERRNRYGHFGSVDDLLSVNGIGPRILERLRGRIYVSSGARPPSTPGASTEDSAPSPPASVRPR